MLLGMLKLFDYSDRFLEYVGVSGIRLGFGPMYHSRKKISRGAGQEVGRARGYGEWEFCFCLSVNAGARKRGMGKQDEENGYVW